MPIRVHDSLTRERRPLEPLEPGRVGLYVCGPTVYDEAHVGHLMGPVIFDAVARWLVARGYTVRFVNNITDIDDKILDRARRTGEAWDAITERYLEQYLETLRRLRVQTITEHPRCTEWVPRMVAFVEDLIRRDRAYVASDGVYYDVTKQPGYGKLSGRKLEDMRAGSRVAAVEGLRDPADFALWKLAKPGEPSWPSPWGDGRPGWHVECSVMAESVLGPEFDLHGGGDDLKFPHHENEIAQSEAHGDAFARAWMHHGLVQYGGRKIAKSDPRMQDEAFARQFLAGELIERYGAPALRFFLLRGHYRRPIDFDPEALEGARTGLLRLVERLGERCDAPVGDDPAAVLTRELPPELAARRDAFAAAMDDDFNTGLALAEMFALAGEGDAGLDLACGLGRLVGLFLPGDREELERAARALGDDSGLLDGLRELCDELDAAAPEGAGADALCRALVERRAGARAAKDFATSDRVRDRLAELGVALHDGAEGTTFERRR